ncbi:hypothetical protein BGW80DRAFT_1565088 [Lactifluus volemus]|nr:hypothetical protein BGW80DRAFT_1565088 [Lactifluus volemus]
MAPPVHHNPSQSQPMAQVQQHASAASPIAPNQGVVKRIRRPPKVWCPKPQCAVGFHAKKALNRHLEDCHSEKKKCYYSGCTFTYVGRRLIFKSFTERLLDNAPLEFKGVEAPDSQTCPPPPQLTEPESMSGLEFFLLNILHSQ